MMHDVILVPHRQPISQVVGAVKVWVGREDLWKSLDHQEERSSGGLLGSGSKNGKGRGKEVVTYGGRVSFVGKLSGIRLVNRWKKNK